MADFPDDLTWIDSVADRFEAECKQGGRPRIEEYLADLAFSQQQQILPELLAVEFHYRHSLSEKADVAEYVHRFPKFEHIVRAAFTDAQECETPDKHAAKQAPPVLEQDGLPSIPGYDVHARLGQGGMGVVYKARQRSLDRIVALKMIRSNRLADAKELTRFRNEAQAIAQLQHPNIVQIHEIGEWRPEEAGAPIPYFSMEYADGGSLAQKLNGAPLPARQAAELVMTLARAIHVAHEAGIIHRDLKPANILMQKDEGERMKDEKRTASNSSFILHPSYLRITDFGLVKLLQQDEMASAGEESTFIQSRRSPPQPPTQTGDILGTPSYMAPEQARGMSKAAGPATDVYALGAILYELLTGRPPFRAESAVDTLMQVMSEEPVPPRRLHSKTPADLDTICLKCLHKDARRRYASTAELADDLQRYLESKPILARPIGVAERSWKWVKRNPARAALAGVILLALAGTISGVIFYQVQITAAWRAEARQRVKTEEKAKIAKKNADRAIKEAGEKLAALKRAEAHLGYAFTALAKVRDGVEKLAPLPQSDTVRRKILEDILVVYDAVLRDQSADPQNQLRRGRAFHGRGTVMRILGKHKDAGESFKKALTVLHTLPAGKVKEETLRLALAQTLHDKAIWHRDMSEIDTAKSCLKKSLDNWEKLLGQNGASTSFRLGLARTLVELGIFYDMYEDSADAEPFLNRAVEINTKLISENPKNAELYHKRAQSKNDLGNHFRTCRQEHEAEKAFRGALADQLKSNALLGIRLNPEYQTFQGRVLQNLAGALYSQRKLADATMYYEQARDLVKPLVDAFPRRIDTNHTLGLIYANLGVAYKKAQHVEDALRAYHLALFTQESIVRDHPGIVFFEKDVANCWYNLAILHFEAGKQPQARFCALRAMMRWDRLVRKNPGDIQVKNNLTQGLRFLAGVVQDMQKPQQAKKLRRLGEWIATGMNRERAQKKEYNNVVVAWNRELGAPEKRNEERDRLRLLFQTWEGRGWLDPDNERSHQELVNVVDRLGELYRKQNLPGLRESLFLRGLDLLQAKAQRDMRPTYWVRLGGAYCNLGGCAITKGDLNLALSWYSLAEATLNEVRTRHPDYQKTKGFLVNTYWGRAVALRQMNKHGPACLAWDKALANAPDPKPTDLLYLAAASHSLAAGAIAGDAGVAEEERKKQVEKYAGRAVQLLEQVRGRGVFARASWKKELNTHAKFDPLRRREDFRRFLKKIEQ